MSSDQRAADAPGGGPSADSERDQASVDADAEPDIDDVFDELEQLEELVDADEELRQVRETMRVLRRARPHGTIGRLRDTFDSRDVGEAMVGSFVFGVPMVVEDGTLTIGRFIGRQPPLLALTVAFGVTLVLGILHAVEFRRFPEDLILGVVPVRLVSILLVSGGMALGLMTLWGRVEWTTPWIAAGQVTVTAIVMAVGASLGDVLPGT
ncbi:hypothetical protein [Halomicrococcus sp. SG-WS-1]|uniref:hypothetical protein n=1 Tax=Halomicrococcus sp. SG-WS-1 TaxID=3439057 RepID=UPI003F78CB50